MRKGTVGGRKRGEERREVSRSIVDFIFRRYKSHLKKKIILLTKNILFPEKNIGTPANQSSSSLGVTGSSSDTIPE